MIHRASNEGYPKVPKDLTITGLVCAFNQEKALVWAFSVIVKPWDNLTFVPSSTDTRDTRDQMRCCSEPRGGPGAGAAQGAAGRGGELPLHRQQRPPAHRQQEAPAGRQV